MLVFIHDGRGFDSHHLHYIISYRLKDMGVKPAKLRSEGFLPLRKRDICLDRFAFNGKLVKLEGHAAN